MAVIPSDIPKILHRWADRFGVGASLLCAAHCALLPLIFALAPALGMSALAGESFERVFAVFASLLAITSLWQGYRRHRVHRALAFLVPGLISIWVAVLYSPLHADLVLHTVLMTFGGTLIGVAHLINLKLTHGHVHDARCSHAH